MIELLLFSAAGILLGVIAGLVPGLHVNTIALLMLGFAGMFQPLYLAAAIISMAIAATFFDFIPSTLLAAPDPETALSVLPGHRMLMQGAGLEAIYLTMLGGLCATLAAALSFPLIVLAIPAFYALVQGYIAWLLIAMAAFAILTEQNNRSRLWGFSIFLLSGILGFAALNSYAFNEPLFPMFTGLFGTSSLLFSLGKHSRMPAQGDVPLSPGRKLLLSGVSKGVVSGVLVGTLPAMGAAQAATLVQHMTKSGSDREYLISIGAINTVVAMFSLISLYTIAKARSGAAVAVGGLLPDIGLNELGIMLGAMLVSAGISSLLLMRIARWFMAALAGIEYDKATKAIIAFLALLVLLLAGIPGLLLFGTGTAIGLLAPLSGTKRSTAMGALMLPLILFYMGA